MLRRVLGVLRRVLGVLRRVLRRVVLGVLRRVLLRVTRRVYGVLRRAYSLSLFDKANNPMVLEGGVGGAGGDNPLITVTVWGKPGKPGTTMGTKSQVCMNCPPTDHTSSWICMLHRATFRDPCSSDTLMFY